MAKLKVTPAFQRYEPTPEETAKWEAERVVYERRAARKYRIQYGLRVLFAVAVGFVFLTASQITAFRYTEYYYAQKAQAENDKFFKFQKDLIDQYMRDHPDSKPETKDFHGDSEEPTPDDNPDGNHYLRY